MSLLAAKPQRMFVHEQGTIIADGVIAHLSELVGSSVRVTLVIEADVATGVPENVVRTVTENSRALKFNSHGFEMMLMRWGDRF